MWLDKREVFSNKKLHIVVVFRNQVASGAGGALDGGGQLQPGQKGLRLLWLNQLETSCQNVPTAQKVKQQRMCLEKNPSNGVGA